MATSSRHFRSRYWFNSILFRSLNMAVNNVRCIRMWYGIKERTSEVREQLANELLEHVTKMERERSFVVRKELGGNTKGACNLDGHWPFPNKGKYRMCRLCKLNKTNNYCIKCNVHIHTGMCYVEWHSK